VEGVSFEAAEVAPVRRRASSNYYKEKGGAETEVSKYDARSSRSTSRTRHTLSTDVVSPSGMDPAVYVMDPRTGLAYYRNYNISNRE